MSAWTFEFTIDTHRLLEIVPIPHRMNRELQEIWAKNDEAKGVIRLHRGTKNKVYPIRLGHVFNSPGKFESFLGGGWSQFVTSNKLRILDHIELLLEDEEEMLYRVRIWRSRKEFTVVDPRVIIEIDGIITEADASEFVPTEVFFKPPSFKFTFTKGYIDKPSINIPVPFSREHFQGLKNPTVVELYVHQKWHATMRFKFDKKKIVACTIRKGVPEMVAGEEIELGEKILVELEGLEPPQFNISFT
ncbi:uncharacterized protein LOC110730657 [Chenopodium quinoa]|uniref:uncharacterized protein LOC110730657 n=1 Tax=Chenopodium quinoa TaxID=63459 RepID=UPI000B77569C|nr:uncharacterized protein LOC110730657 [Chenopodium quinoa]